LGVSFFFVRTFLTIAGMVIGSQIHQVFLPQTVDPLLLSAGRLFSQFGQGTVFRVGLVKGAGFGKEAKICSELRFHVICESQHPEKQQGWQDVNYRADSYQPHQVHRFALRLPDDLDDAASLRH
jgi:hypothetical protein